MVYLLSENTLKSNSIINDNVDTMYILPAIETAQDMGLQPILGTKLYNTLKSMVDSGEIAENEDYRVLLDDYITPFLINKVVADIQLNIHFKVRNQGVVQQTGEHITYPSLKDIQYFVQSYNDKATFYGNRLTDYLIANHNKYKEFCKADCSDMRSKRQNFSTNIYLG